MRAAKIHLNKYKRLIISSGDRYCKLIFPGRALPSNRPMGDVPLDGVVILRLD